jgi:hypothetical protein
MILIDKVPCMGCEHYMGIVKPDGTEKTEHIKCAIAREKDAKNMLKGLRCDNYDKNERKQYSF